MLKRNLKVKICRFCLNTKCDIDLKVIEVIKEVLEIVLPKLNLEEGDKHLICNSCSVKLFAAFNFKSVCTDTEDTIFPYVNSQKTPLVDLKEIYLKEKRDIQLIDILEYQKICRLCFQLVKCGFVSLNEVDADIIDNYIPEVNFNATKDPVICKLCSDSLVTHGTFLSSCLAAQEESRKVCDDPAEDRECCIKTEEIKIEDDWESDPPTRLENVETIKNFDGRFSSENKPVNNKKYPPGKVQTYTCNRCNFKTVHKYSMKRHYLTHVSLTTTYISSKSHYKSKNRDASSPCPLKDQVRMFQCQKCRYKTHLKDAFISHWWTHKVSSKMKVYQCEKCHYRVTRKDHFCRHQLRHEDSAETIENSKGRLNSENIPVKKIKRLPRKVRTYKCNRCDFKTTYKNSLKRHSLKHVSLTLTCISPKSQCKRESRDASLPCPLEHQVRMYQCKKCPYRTHVRQAFISHWWTYKVPSEMKVYQCEKCHYKVTREDRFHRHQLRHEDSAEAVGNFKGRLGSSENIPVKKENIRPGKCDKCDFQTKYKRNLLRHQLLHKRRVWKDVKCYTTGDRELIYKCNLCIFTTKDKSHFLVHRLRHSQPKFKCRMCAYESDDKDKLTRHQTKHSTGMKTLKCDLCSYQTIWKPNFVRHQLRHKKKCEVKTYDCCKCNFRTKYKNNLMRHELLHRP